MHLEYLDLFCSIQKQFQGKKECLRVAVLYWYVGILLEGLVWLVCFDLWIKGYLCLKTIFCNKVALDV